MRRLAAIVGALLLFPQDAWGAAQHATNSGATNTGQSVSVEAREVTSNGGGGGSGQRGRSRPAVDYRAAYAELSREMARAVAQEVPRRAAEHAAYSQLQAHQRHCAAQARHFGALATRRIQVEVRVPVKTTYVVWEMRPVATQVRESYRAGVGLTWVTRWRTATRIVWRAVPVTRTKVTWVTRTKWVTVHNPAAAVAAAAYRGCADRAGVALANLAHQITARRAAWDAHWASLNRAAHEAWRAFNTTCRTVREVGNADVRQCTYEAWRNYSPGSFERTIVAAPVRPPDQLIRQARDQVTPPGPVIRMSPKVEWEQIVQLPTWMWIEPGAWRPETARAEAGQAWANATATPARVIWDMGNGDRVVCGSPGTPYDEGRHESRQRTACSYTYRQSSAGQPDDAYTVTATLVYDVTWQGSGGAGGGLGTISRTSTVRVRVAELQALVNWFA